MPAPKGNTNASKPEGEKKSSFLYIRAEPEDKAIWVKHSREKGLKLSAWVTETLNNATKR